MCELIFNPHAPSNRHPRCYRKHEVEKKRQYEQRVREIEHASFTPLVLSATGGMANETTVFYKRLASCLATKWNQPYSSTMSWLRCQLTFSLLTSVSYPVHKGCPLQLWSYCQVEVPDFGSPIGLGYDQIKFKLANFFLHSPVLLFTCFSLNFIVGSLPFLS